MQGLPIAASTLSKPQKITCLTPFLIALSIAFTPCCTSFGPWVVLESFTAKTSWQQEKAASSEGKLSKSASTIEQFGSVASFFAFSELAFLYSHIIKINKLNKLVKPDI